MLKIYNTLSRKKEEFVPINKNIVTMYNCGLTVYDYAHIGNLRAFTMADTVRRGLEFLGYKVNQVQNFTDVGHLVSDGDDGQDKLEKGAMRTGKTVWEVAEFYIKNALEDFKLMNFKEPSVRPRATEHIVEQIEMIKGLLDSGLAYETTDSVYYDTAKFDGYGKLTGQNLSDKKTGSRDEVVIDSEKRNPSDFRLWQKAIGENSNHAMQWDSPWGRGFPGWHIECSAMAMKYLGETIDIHTGGVDHIPIHHTNEIAQSEGVSGKPFSNYWMHNEFLMVEGTKMSKSLGNFYTLKDLLNKGIDPLDLRYFYYTTNFRQVQNLTIQGLEDAKKMRSKLLAKLDFALEANFEDYENNSYYIKFKTAIEDSFNMPVCIAVLIAMINDKQLESNQKLFLFNKFNEVLAIK